LSQVLVTGAGGYIGSQLVRLLLAEGHKVIAVDRYFFGTEVLDDVAGKSNLMIVKADCRQLDKSHLYGVNAVFDLVALSNDPSGDLDPVLTREINFESRLRTSELAKSCGVARYILMSSCSVYGSGLETSLNEESLVNPLTIYAKSSLDAENSVLPLNSETFSVSVMRNATVFGLSRRMRFDLVINLMVATAFERNEIVVTGGGEQTRPLVHVDDVCQAALQIFQSEPSKTGGQIFNIGLGNFQVIQLAFMIREILGKEIKVTVVNEDADKRSYNVSFEKARLELGFNPTKDITFGVEQIYDALVKRIVLRDERTSTVNWYRRLREAERLFKDLSIDGKII